MGSPRTLALVAAHPDDDAYGLAGTVALHAADPDFRYVLVHVTDGEAGDIRKVFPATRKTLGAIRREECDKAWRALGRVPDRHEWLGYPDGAVDQVPQEELVQRIVTILQEESPDVVATFGPDGITGHPDHIGVGAATDAAFLRCAGTGRTGFKRLLHGALPQSVFDRWNARREANGQPAFDPTQVYQLRGVPDEQIDVTVDCSDVADRIVAGLLQHRSAARTTLSTADSQTRGLGDSRHCAYRALPL
ncbi:MAG: N-acetylglucosamine malate deacetylase 2 [Actinomycetota bacterium]|nr:N-acetylglucosamine malate deacetylase 2 [Actinomycetota bacterium]